jgi:hypothetical protein
LSKRGGDRHTKGQHEKQAKGENSRGRHGREEGRKAGAGQA